MTQRSQIFTAIAQSEVWLFAKELLGYFGKVWFFLASLVGSLVLVGFGVGMFLMQSSTQASYLQEFSQKVTSEGNPEQTIAVVSLVGPIVSAGQTEGLSFQSGLIDADATGTLLDSLAQEEDIKAVILKINSPGGAVVASDVLYRKVKNLRDHKPVIAVLEDTAASGGYYVAVGATKIVANPATLTGSIGVIAQFPNLEGLFSKVGVELETFKSGQYKDIGSPDRAVTDDEKAIFNQIISDSYEQFVAAIVEGRGLEKAEVLKLADGRVYSGIQAQKLGLVDYLGTVETGIDQAKELATLSEPHVVEYSTDSLWKSLFGAVLPWSGLKSQTSSLFQTGLYYR